VSEEYHLDTWLLDLIQRQFYAAGAFVQRAGRGGGIRKLNASELAAVAELLTDAASTADVGLRQLQQVSMEIAAHQVGLTK
jgi:hypothetical protein